MAFHSDTCSSVFALDTFMPLFSTALLHCSSSNSSTPFSLAHSTTSSANIICQGASFLIFSVSDGKQERAESGSLLEVNFHCKGFACSCSTPHYSCAVMILVIHQSNELLWHPLASHAPIRFFPGNSVVCFFQINDHTM